MGIRFAIVMVYLAAGRDAGAVTSDDVWQTASLTPQSGTFEVEMEITPSDADADGVIGLSAASPVADYPELAAIWRFDAAGFIDVRDTDRYRADAALVYTPGTTYHLRVAIDVPSHTYSVWVTPAGESEVALATDYRFRSEQQGVTELCAWATRTTVGTMEVEGFTLLGPGGPDGGGGGGGDGDYPGAAGCASGEYYDFFSERCVEPREQGCAAVDRRGLALLMAFVLFVRRRR